MGLTLHTELVDPATLREVAVDPGWLYCHESEDTIYVYRTELIELHDYPMVYDLIHDGSNVLTTQEYYEDDDMVGVETVFEVYMKG